jgi:hypothetical protein
LRSLFGAEDLVEVILVWPMRIARLTGQGFKGVATPGNFNALVCVMMRSRSGRWLRYPRRTPSDLDSLGYFYNRR